MLTKQEKDFITYWEKNREREKKLLRQVFIGLPIGLLISAGVIISLNLNWYPRANMVANASLNPYILLIAVTVITIFIAIFYNKHRWDVKEQHYRELLYKREKEQGTLT